MINLWNTVIYYYQLIFTSFETALIALFPFVMHLQRICITAPWSFAHARTAILFPCIIESHFFALLHLELSIFTFTFTFLWIPKLSWTAIVLILYALTFTMSMIFHRNYTWHARFIYRNYFYINDVALCCNTCGDGIFDKTVPGTAMKTDILWIIFWISLDWNYNWICSTSKRV